MTRIINLITAIFIFVLAGANDYPHRICEEEKTDYETLDKKLNEYFSVIEYKSFEVQKEECDFIIEACTDSLVKQFTAIKTYQFFYESKIMGIEGTAIHIFDRWFKSGEIKFKSEFDYFAANLHSEMNRPTLIGKVAPPISIGYVSSYRDSTVREISVDIIPTCPETIEAKLSTEFIPTSQIAPPPIDTTTTETSLKSTPAHADTTIVEIIPSEKKNYKVLYFYDVDCAKCKLESIKLRSVMDNTDPSVEFIPINVAEGIDLSDFHKTYGLIQTPRLFLLSPDDTIVGRGLDAESLELLLSSIFEEIEYGSEESFKIYESLFSSYEKRLSPEIILENAKLIHRKTALNTHTQKLLIGDLLYFLSNQKGYIYKKGGYDVAQFILNDDIWQSKDDSLKVISLAEMMTDLYSKSEIGTEIANIRVPAQRLSSKRGTKISNNQTNKISSKRGRKINLSKLRGQRNIIIFYTSGCNDCKTEIEKAKEIISHKTRVYLVNVDNIFSNDIELTETLFENLDLSSLPYIIETDRRGIIKGKYITFVE